MDTIDYYKLKPSKLWNGTKYTARIEAAKRGMSLVSYLDLLVRLATETSAGGQVDEEIARRAATPGDETE